MTNHEREKIARAQQRNAQRYRDNARRAPWNSNARREWLRLAEAAERAAEFFKQTGR